MASQFTIYMSLALNFDYSQTLLGTCGLGYRCLTMPCSLHKKCMTLGARERKKKEKIEFQKKNFHLSFFLFYLLSTAE